MINLKLCESDYKFMSVIWDNEPLSSSALVQICNEKLGWKKPTTYTTLKKLCEKGFAKNENTIVSSIISQSEVQAYASKHFIENTFQGSLPKFLCAFLDSKKLDDKEIAELEQLIKDYKGN